MDALPPAIRTLLQRLEVNRAVAFLLVSRGWQFLSGFLTVVLLSSCLNKDQLGVYYVFLSLVGMQMFFELGLPGIVSLVTSHEWAQLRFDADGSVQGEPLALGRLASLYRFFTRWFAVCAVLFLIGISIYGYFEIVAGEIVEGHVKPVPLKITEWLPPWLALVAINAIALPYLPKLTMLEGCHQVDTINYYRLLQAVSGTLVVWLVLYVGGGLWALVASGAVRWSWEFYLVQVRYRAAFVSLERYPVTDIAACFREIWPLFWRVAIQTIGQYFSTFYFTLVVLDILGFDGTGPFSLTWTILFTLQGAAQSWVNTRMPEFGAMASRGEHQRLRQRLIKTGLISLAVFLAGAASFLFVVQALRNAKIKYAASFLDWPTTCLLTTGLGLLLLTNILQISVRLYKKDPFLIPNSLTSLAIAVCVWQAAQLYGTAGVGAAYAIVVGVWSLPVSAYLAWRNQRQLAEMRVLAES